MPLLGNLLCSTDVNQTEKQGAVPTFYIVVLAFYIQNSARRPPHTDIAAQFDIDPGEI